MNVSLNNLNLIRTLKTAESTTWLRIIVVLGTVFLSGILAFRAPQRLLILVPIFLLGIFVVFVLLDKPQLGLIALIGTIIIPFSGPSGLNATMALVALLFGLSMFESLVIKRKFEILNSITIKPLFALILVAAFSFGFGQLPWFAFTQHASMGAQLGGLSLFFLSAGAFWVIAHQLKDIRYLQWMVWIFLTIATLFLIPAWLVPQLGLQEYVYRIIHVRALGNQFYTWLIALAFSQAIFNKSLHNYWRLALGGLTLCVLYVALGPMRYWNSGWLPMLIAIVSILIAARPRIGIIVLIIGGIGIMTKMQSLVDFMMGGGNDYSLSTRVDAWIILLNMAKTSPILGFGPANYNAYTPLFPIRGYHVNFNSHSQYVDLIAQTGLLGLISFIWFFATVGWVGWKLRERVPEGFAQAYVYGALGGWVATIAAAGLGDWVIPFYFNLGLGGFRASFLGWIFLGGMIAIDQMVKSADMKSTGGEGK